MKKVFIFPILVLLAFSSAQADELIQSREYFQRRGYAPVRSGAILAADELDHDLPWPVKFVDGSHSVAQNYVNFQEYGDGAYFHGGCDLRSPGNSDVVATVSGVLEGGFYGYVTHADGSMEKQWRPWAGKGRHDPYFELAIVTDQGYRFEYHHVDSEKLPASTVAALNQGHVRIQAGTVIGKVNAWAFAFEDYPHIHYNIIRADGVQVNPEFYSLATADHTAPIIHGVYGVTSSGRTVELHEGERVSADLKEIVVAATESHDDDAYVQTPLLASIAFEQGASFTWDFRKFLRTSEGRFPDIWSVFKADLNLPDGESLSTSGQFGRGLSLLRLPIPAGAVGHFVITIGDTAGNQSQVGASLDRP